MLVLIVRTFLLYILVVMAMRIMGKRQIGEMQPSELVAAIMISDLASVPMQTIDIPLVSGIVPVLTLLVGEVVLSYASLKSKKIRRFVAGEPSIVIYQGKVNEKELERLRFNLNDLMEQLRLAGYPDATQVDMAVIETNGQVSVLEKSQDGMAVFPFMLIADGEVNMEELRRANKDMLWLTQKVSGNIKDVFLAILTEDGKLHIQRKEKK